MATEYRRHRYEYSDVDVIVLDGIFPLKKQYRALYDLAIWVDCTFATAMERALQRNQEGLAAAEIVREYETIYFPAEAAALQTGSATRVSGPHRNQRRPTRTLAHVRGGSNPMARGHELGARFSFLGDSRRRLG